MTKTVEVKREEIEHTVKELILDLDHEIMETGKAFPPSDSGSILGEFHSATNRVALCGLHTAKSLIMSRFSEFLEN